MYEQSFFNEMIKIKKYGMKKKKFIIIMQLVTVLSTRLALCINISRSINFIAPRGIYKY